MTTIPKWKPLRRAGTKPASAALIGETMRIYKINAEEAKRMLDEYESGSEYWLNDLYQVQVRRFDVAGVHINIRRRDGGPILRDWRHFQQIKNELLGPECEAIELYPAESRKVDESNKYHLFGYSDGRRIPIGFETRNVNLDTQGDRKTDRGMRQRGKTMEFPEGVPTRRCQMCGAIEDEMHHDRSARDRVTTLSQITHEDKPMLVCMLCEEGHSEWKAAQCCSYHANGGDLSLSCGGDTP
jgi:hypothetical protein